MSEFINSLNTLKPSLSFTEMDFAELNESAIENPSLGFMASLSNASLLPHQPQFNMPFVDNLLSFSPCEYSKPVSESETCKKRKPETAAAVAETSSGNSLVREDKSKRRKDCSGIRSSKEGEKPKEVVHVRARRGQATDSHSLAERVRRERINEKMRYLQDLVPGCYKTMGMATMLDEIINYVQSLQNQVEFLSMKLSAASSFYDFNLDLESMAAPQQYLQIGNALSEARDVETLERYEGYGGLTGFNSILPF